MYLKNGIFLIFFSIFSILNTNDNNKPNWTITDLSINNIDSINIDFIAAQCLFWSEQDLLPHLNINYYKIYLLISSISIPFFKNEQAFSDFWQAVDNKTRSQWSYLQRLNYYLYSKLYEINICEVSLKELYNIQIQNINFIKQKGIFTIKNPQSNREIIGALLYSIEKIDQTTKELTIDAIAVSKKFRRKGVALALLQHVEMYAKQHFLKSISFSTFSTNNPMLNCALKLEYTLDGRKDNLSDMYDEPISCLYFKKNINLNIA